MRRGLYTSAIGMITQMNNMDVITNNIANVDTASFKEDISVVQSFSEELMKRLDDNKYRLITRDNNVGKVTLGNFVTEVSTNFKTGSIKETGNTYDLAIRDEGFFSIEVADNNGEISEKYTRDGSFTRNYDGMLLTKEGNYVLGENGRIAIPPGSGQIDIKEDGSIYSNGEFVDKLKIVDFENKDSLRKYGDNLYDSTEDTKIINVNPLIIQNHLEGSNVNIVDEMVKMINVSRVYELNQKMVQSQDEILGKAVNDIARK